MTQGDPIVHPVGECLAVPDCTNSDQLAVDTFAGKVHVEWNPTAAVTPIGQLPFFVQFLKVGGLFESWLNSCPLHYRSNNAPKKVDVLGSFLLSILSGHNPGPYWAYDGKSIRDIYNDTYEFE